MATPFPPRGLHPKYTPKPTRPKTQNQLVVERGLKRINETARKMMLREMAELEGLVRINALPEEIIEHVKTIRTLEEKRAFLTRYWREQRNALSAKDIDFPMVMNRKAFIERMQGILSQSKPNMQHSVIFFDTDWLRKVNKKFGRIEGGHAVLTTFAKALGSTVERSSGFAGHVYGDEFMAYLPWPPKLAKQFIQAVFEPKWREEMTGWKYYKKSAEKKLKLTYSAGIQGVRKGDSVSSALVAADNLCDKAKAQGRGRNTYAISNKQLKTT